MFEYKRGEKTKRGKEGKVLEEVTFGTICVGDTREKVHLAGVIDSMMNSRLKEQIS